MTAGFRLARRRRWYRGAPLLAFLGLFFLLQGMEAPEGDCGGAAPADSPRNPLCVGPLAPAEALAVEALGVALLVVALVMAVAWWRARFSRADAASEERVL